VTVAQLVHPVRSLAWRPRRAFRSASCQDASRLWCGDGRLWRAIATGLGFALVALTMMALAIGAAGVAPPLPGLHGGVPVAVRALPDQPLGLYYEPALALTGAMPVP